MMLRMKCAWVLCAGLFSVCSLFGDIQVSGSLTRIGRGRPGESYEGSIKLHNTGSKSEEVRLYKRDYLFFADGRVLYEEPGINERTNAPWIEFSPSILTIPAKEEAEIGYRVRIPDDRQLSGTYWSLLFIEGAPDEADIPETKDKLTLAIRQVIRYGIQLITEIAETGDIALHFANPTLQKVEGRYTLKIDVENTGTIWLRPKFSCTIFNLLGAELAFIHAGEKRLYPGTSTRAVFELPHMDSGKYRALVLADGGGENLFGANYTLEIED